MIAKRVRRLAKGFSFVLVSVVMVMMMVFGMLSLSSASADLRLSKKAAAAQTTYYSMDSKATRLAGGCAQASASAWADAQAFVKDKKYLSSQPETTYACVTPLIEAARANPGVNDAALTKGLYFCFLSKRLDVLKNDTGLAMNSISVKTDEAALAAALSGGNNVIVTTVDALVKGGEKNNNSLDVTFTCACPADTAPVFKTVRWKASVSGLDISDNKKIKVFGS